MIHCRFPPPKEGLRRDPRPPPRAARLRGRRRASRAPRPDPGRRRCQPIDPPSLFSRPDEIRSPRSPPGHLQPGCKSLERGTGPPQEGRRRSARRAPAHALAASPAQVPARVPAALKVLGLGPRHLHLKVPGQGPAGRSGAQQSGSGGRSTAVQQPGSGGRGREVGRVGRSQHCGATAWVGRSQHCGATAWVGRSGCTAVQQPGSGGRRCNSLGREVGVGRSAGSGGRSTAVQQPGSGGRGALRCNSLGREVALVGRSQAQSSPGRLLDVSTEGSVDFHVRSPLMGVASARPEGTQGIASFIFSAASRSRFGSSSSRASSLISSFRRPDTRSPDSSPAGPDARSFSYPRAHRPHACPYRRMRPPASGRSPRGREERSVGGAIAESGTTVRAGSPQEGRGRNGRPCAHVARAWLSGPTRCLRSAAGKDSFERCRPPATVHKTTRARHPPRDNGLLSECLSVSGGACRTERCYRLGNVRGWYGRSFFLVISTAVIASPLSRLSRFSKPPVTRPKTVKEFCES